MKNSLNRIWGWPLALFVIIAAAYGPFLGTRFIRTAGDEKVYISQALEMARDGRWFVQTLMDVPDYYKGPLHFLLLRLGFLIFGLSSWAVLYMNLLLVFAGALAVGKLVERRLPPGDQASSARSETGLPLFAASFFALSVGIYAHMFASQMEVELASFFAVGLYLLDRLKPEQAGFGFWILAGVIGWIKAPLHSVFLGVTALLFWLSTGQLFEKIKNWKAWAAALCGIAVCVAGFAPVLVFDYSNFVSTYISKEILGKIATNQSRWVTINSAFGFYLLPWLFLALVSYFQLVARLPRLVEDLRARRMLALGFSGFIPSVLFFLWHPYRFENYNLPVISGILLLIVTAFHFRTAVWDHLYRLGFLLTAVLAASFPILLTILAGRFSPLPAWWPGWLVPFVWITSLLSVVGILWFGVFGKTLRLQWLAPSALGVFWAIGAFCAVLGEREMVDLRALIAETKAHGARPELVYYNLHVNMFSEWGLLSCSVGTPIPGIHAPDRLRQAMMSGKTVLVPAGEGTDHFRAFIKREFPPEKGNVFVIRPWKRWKTHGAENNVPLWRVAWDRRDLSILERDYLIVRRVSGPS